MRTPRVYRSKAYKFWYRSLSAKEQGVVDTRIDTCIEKGLFLSSKLLDANYGLYEFKWISGMRVYYAFLQDSEGSLMLLLLGGNKNTQQKDIVDCKNIIIKATGKIQLKNLNELKKRIK